MKSNSAKTILPCALCQLNKRLVKSHIIPDFLLKDAEDLIETGRQGQKQPHLTLVDYVTAKRVYCKQKGNVLKTVGFVQNLLCEDCEKLIKIGEDYVRTCLFGKESKKQHTRPAKSYRRYRVRRGKVLRQGFDIRWVDYEKFKRFQISIIWRISVAKGEAFQKFKVSASTREKMRLALLNGVFDVGLVPCAMQLFDDPKGISFGVVTPPFGCEDIATIIMGGYQWYFYLKQKAPTEIILQANGRLPICVSDVDELYTLDAMLEKI